jgi:hypothetical protein
MKITLTVKENKASLLLAFLKTLGYVKIEEEQELYIPEWHKKLVRERINNTPVSEYKNWNNLSEKFSSKK